MRGGAVACFSLCKTARRFCRKIANQRPKMIYLLWLKRAAEWLARVREADPDSDPVPRFIERDLRRYLDCRILARGSGVTD